MRPDSLQARCRLRALCINLPLRQRIDFRGGPHYHGPTGGSYLSLGCSHFPGRAVRIRQRFRPGTMLGWIFLRKRLGAVSGGLPERDISLVVLGGKRSENSNRARSAGEFEADGERCYACSIRTATVRSRNERGWDGAGGGWVWMVFGNISKIAAKPGGDSGHNRTDWGVDTNLSSMKLKPEIGRAHHRWVGHRWWTGTLRNSGPGKRSGPLA